jgi:hypothetical protein
MTIPWPIHLLGEDNKTGGKTNGKILNDLIEERRRTTWIFSHYPSMKSAA